GAPSCVIPAAGIRWQPTRQPLYSRMWPGNRPSRSDAPYTTLVAWNTYQPQRYLGRTYGTKDVEFLRFAELPLRCNGRFVLAMDGSPPKPARELEEMNWVLTDGFGASRDLRSYRDLIAWSRGEWSVAYNAYVSLIISWL